MQPRKLKNSRLILWCALLFITLVPALIPEPAHAYAFPNPGPAIQGGQVCPNGFGLTRRIVPCIKDTIILATRDFLLPFSAFMATTVKAMCMLSIIIGGVWVATGCVNAAMRDMSVLAIKISFVLVFTWNFGGMFSLLLDVMDELLLIVGSYAVFFSSLTMASNCPPFSAGPMSLWVWEQVDCAIETLLGGIFSPATLMTGLAGFLFACLFSTTAGFFIALLGFYIIAQFLFACARATYTFISAYIAFAIMVIFSPLFIPCILLRVTKPYFDKWLRLTLSFVLQPMILFAYLSMLMAALDHTIFVGPNSVYRMLAGDAVDTPGFELGTYLLGVGAYSDTDVGGQTVGVDPQRVLNELGAPIDVDSGAAGHIGNTIVESSAAWRTDIYQYLGLGDGSALRFFKVDLPTQQVDWKWLALWDWFANGGDNPINADGDVDPTAFMVKIFVAFFMAAVVTYIFMTMIESLPYLSAGIAGSPAGMHPLGTGNMAPPGSNLMETFKAKMEGLSRGERVGGGGGGGR